MGKIRRGNYVFVHVYRDGSLVLKWSLDDWYEEPGFSSPPKKLRKILEELMLEGKFGYESKKSRF